jgi:hypothetical protein
MFTVYRLPFAVYRLPFTVIARHARYRLKVVAFCRPALSCRLWATGWFVQTKSRAAPSGVRKGNERLGWAPRAAAALGTPMRSTKLTV